MKIKITALTMLLIIAIYVLKLLHDAGVFRQITNFEQKKCIPILNIAGPEDMAKLPETSIVVISSDPRNENSKTQNGRLYFYDTKTKNPVGLMEFNFPKDFAPHGIDVVKTGQDFFIFAVDQFNADQTRIDLFKANLDKSEIRFIKSFNSPNFTAANDISAISENHFFYTRDFNTKKKWLVALEQYLRYPTGSIWEYDNGQEFSLQENLFYANGIQYDSKTSTLYASEMLNKIIHSYQYTNHSLSPKKSIKIPDGIDNLTLTPDKLIAAGHPNLLALKKMRDHREYKSPSVVYAVDLDLSKLTKIYENDGSQIAATSVALKISNSEYIFGSVFDDHLLECSF